MSNPTRPGPAQPAPVTGPGPMDTKVPTTPMPGNIPSGPFPAPGFVEADNARRGQRVIDANKDAGKVDVTPRHTDAWPPKK